MSLLKRINEKELLRNGEKNWRKSFAAIDTTREEQENVFICEVEKRIDDLAAELDLDAYFVLGFLTRIIHNINRDLDEEDENDND